MIALGLKGPILSFFLTYIVETHHRGCYKVFFNLKIPRNHHTKPFQLGVGDYVGIYFFFVIFIFFSFLCEHKTPILIIQFLSARVQCVCTQGNLF